LKRTYFLVAIATVELLVGTVMVYGAAAPVRTSGDVLIVPTTYYHYEFGILGTGRLSGNLSELSDRPFTLFIFDDSGYASFRAGSNSVPPLFEQNGTGFLFEFELAGPGQYHVVFVDFPARGELQVHLDLLVVGLKTNETILAIVVILGGLALVGAALMMSVWATRHGPPPLPDPISGPPDPAPETTSDDTRIF